MKNINTKKVRRLNEETLLVTIDIGMTMNTGYCRCPNGAEIKPFEFSNGRSGFDEFWDRVCRTKKANNLKKVVVGCESTGPYAEPLLAYLRRHEVKIVQVNPFHTKRLKELQGNSPGKTDKKDPKVIADIIELGHALTVVVPEGPAAELRRLTAARERGLQRRTALLNQLHSLLFIIFPEFIRVMKDMGNKTSQYLLKLCCTPEGIIAHGVEALASVLKKISRGNIGRDRAEELRKAAQESVGVREGQKSLALEVAAIVAALGEADRFISMLEGEMDRHLGEIPYSRSILSIKGIGTIITAGLIGEIGDFSEFRTIGEVMKLAGLDLYEISSGQHKGKKRISKRGRRLLRKLLFYAAIGAVRKGGIMHDRYQKYIERGMLRMKALIAIARKLLGIICAIVREQTVFVANYCEIKYQLKEAA